MSYVTDAIDAELSRVTFVRAYSDFDFVPPHPQLPNDWAWMISARFAPIDNTESKVNFAELGLVDGFLFKGTPVSFSLSALHVRPLNTVVVFVEPEGPTKNDLDWLKMRQEIYGTNPSSPIVSAASNKPCNFFDLWDEGIRRYMGADKLVDVVLRAEDPREMPMRFGPVAMITGRVDKGSLGMDVTVLPGLTEESEVLVATNMVAVQDAKSMDVVGTSSDLEGNVDGTRSYKDFRHYQIIGAHFAMMRLKQSHLRAAINQVANLKTERVLSATESIALMDESVVIERQAVHLLANLGARDFLSGSQPALLAMKLLDNVGLDERDIERLIQSLQSLSRFTGNVFAAASFKAQRDLNRVGFVLGILTVIFSAFAITSFHTATGVYRMLVLLSWVIAMLLVFVAFRMERIRPRILRNSSRHTSTLKDS